MASKRKPGNVDNQQKSSIRPPIVTILGHVDHGKTTLLDYIRKTNIAKREAGGITQSIGASVITTDGGHKITFIDTPGHEAFSKMRSRGANIADIAVLVVAANDGVKPQTKEAIKFIKDADIPMIVAITKIDLPSISIPSVKDQIIKEGISLEEAGGDVPLVEVSGKTGKGVNDLLEMITLLFEVKVKDNLFKGEFEGVVIETNKDRRKGLLVTVLIRKGELNVSDQIAAGGFTAKVKGLFNHVGENVKMIKAGEPALVLGFSQLPLIGSKVYPFVGDSPVEKNKEQVVKDSKMRESDIPIVLKASTAGGLEAVLDKIPEGVFVISSGVGDVTDSDVFMAKSSENARIIVFESKVPNLVKKLARTEGVKIDSFKIIYELIEKLEKFLKEEEIELVGKAKVLAIFPFNGKKIVGCKISEGQFLKKGKFFLQRSDKKVADLKAISIRKGKQDIESAKAGEEIGILFSPQLDFKPGDMILSIR